jgi:hypothetical protein
VLNEIFELPARHSQRDNPTVAAPRLGAHPAHIAGAVPASFQLGRINLPIARPGVATCAHISWRGRIASSPRQCVCWSCSVAGPGA